MFWEARMRHYRARPLRRLREALRHVSFVVARHGLNFAYMMKRKMRL